MMTNSSASVRVRASNIVGWLSALVALLVLFCAPLSSAVAQENSDDIGILIVDLQRVQRDAAASISVRRQITDLRSELEIIVAQRSKAISDEEASLAEERERLSPDEFRSRVRDFDKKVFANRDFAQREAGKLQALQAQAQASIRRSIAPILSLIMKEREAKLLLDKSQVVLSLEALEVTDEVLARLDEAMPSLVLAPLRPAD